MHPVASVDLISQDPIIVWMDQTNSCLKLQKSDWPPASGCLALATWAG